MIGATSYSRLYIRATRIRSATERNSVLPESKIHISYAIQPRLQSPILLGIALPHAIQGVDSAFVECDWGSRFRKFATRIFRVSENPWFLETDEEVDCHRS
jgi:hypothetical protein